MSDALAATLAHSLGLSSKELAEIGGFSDRFARYLLAGRRPFPADVLEAIELLDDDCEVMTDAMAADCEEGEAVIWMYGTNADLRAARPDIPGRGKAKGAFLGPYRIAALAAREALEADGVEIDILFKAP